ncbi:MAG: hypothetical protein K8R85_14485 [Bacteroidetes bacterium]|nr:hypothetical protein [Bacteroidota bacterium]
MEQYDILKNALRGLAKIQLHLDSIGGPAENSEIFEEYCQIRESILQRFGLPNSNTYGNIFFVKSIPTDTELDAMIKNLQQTASEYLLAPVKTEAQMLQEAIDQKIASEQVLSELGITQHIYTNFVYREILLTKKDNSLSVLEALRLADEPKTLNLLGIVALCKVFGEEEQNMLQYLTEKGIKYLEPYLSAFQLNGKDKEIELSQIGEFWNNLNGGYEFKTLDEQFNTLTHYLMNYLCLLGGDQPYRIIETEIYYHEKAKHPDPYVHCATEQLFAGNWYFNGSGLDITFGNHDKKIYGGILIRGIRTLEKTPRYISGPSNVLKEIFSNLGSVVHGTHSICLRELNEKTIKEIETLKCSRIGLTKKKEDTENYIEKKYRYIVELNLLHKFKDKEKIVKQLFIENKITKEQTKEILGYYFTS